MLTKLAPVAAAAALFASSAIAAPPPLPPGTPAYASLKGDAVAGKAVFTACKTCHVITPGQNRIGPWQRLKRGEPRNFT